MTAATEGSGGGGKASEAADEGKQVASDARDRAKTVGSHAAGQGQEFASTAADRAGDVAGTAKSEVIDLKEEAAVHARALVDQTTTQLSEQAESQTQRARQALGDLADQAAALAEGRTDEAGDLPYYAQQLSGQLRQASQRLDERGFQGLLGDTQRFARRRPGAFLLAAAGLGVLAGRLGRGAKDAGGDGGGPSRSPQPSENERLPNAPTLQQPASGTTGAGTSQTPGDATPAYEPTRPR